MENLYKFYFFSDAHEEKREKENQLKEGKITTRKEDQLKEG